jgi:hypothetical protein
VLCRTYFEDSQMSHTYFVMELLCVADEQESYFVSLKYFSCAQQFGVVVAIATIMAVQ